MLYLISKIPKFIYSTIAKTIPTIAEPVLRKNFAKTSASRFV